MLKNAALYLSIDLDVGNYIGANANVNYVIKNRYCFQFGFSGHFRRARSRPENYSGGVFGFLGPIPFDTFESSQLLVGRVVKINAKGSIRLNLLGGAAYTFLREPTNWQSLNGSFWGPSHTFEYARSEVFSFVLNPKIEFPFTRVYGLSFAMLMQVNKERTLIGVGIGQLIGKLH